ncbi:MAG: carboxymuconolactone decarboxylase family protein [Euryarchaeota archaeon]
MSREPGEPARDEEEKGLIAVRYAREMLGDEYADLVEEMHKLVWRESPLDPKTTHLIALALAAAAGDDRRVELIAETARNVADVTDEEIAATLALVAWVEGVSKSTRAWGVLRR